MPAGFVAVPLNLIRQAIRAVPAVRYALGVVGIAAAAALVLGLLGGDVRVAVFAPIGLLVLMVMLLLFAKLAAQTEIPGLRGALLVLIWMPLIITFAAILLLGTSVFFGKPLDLRSWLTGKTAGGPPSPTPAQVVYKEVQELPTVIKPYEHITLKPGNREKKVVVTRMVKIQPHGTLEIAPGVSLAFERELGIHCEGTLIARGTAEERIRFSAVDPTVAWGNVVVLAPRGDESSFAYCDFERGGGAPYFEPNTLISDDESQFKPATGRPRIGGALILFAAGNVRIERCRFLQCHATKAGAVYVRSTQTAIIDCEFIGNSVSSNGERAAGGAIYAQNSTLTIVDCRFTKNRAVDKYSCGGAIYLGFRSGCSVLRTTFRRNQATHAGGAIYALNLVATRPRGREVLRVSAGFQNTEFIGNTAGSGGGAIYVDQGFSCDLDGVRFRGNAIGNTELPVGARGAPNGLLDGAAVMANSEVLENRSAIRFGDNPCEFLGNAVFVAEGKLAERASPIRAVFVGENVDGQESDAATEIITVHESPLPVTCYRRQRDERKIDTVVVHHISAVKWFAEDYQRKLATASDVKEAVEKIGPVAETLHEWKYRWDACKTILQVYRISSHYLISREGRIIRLVHENDVALHAGKSAMPPPDGRTNVDQFSVAVELIASDPQDDHSLREDVPAYTDEQYRALRKTLALIFWRCADSAAPPDWSVVGHNEIATTDVRGAGTAKRDPGPTFAWAQFRDERKRLLHAVVE